MRQAQVLVYESDGKLAQLLRPVVEERGSRLRELRQANTVMDVLREGATVLVLKIGRDLFEEMSLLEQVSWGWPETATVVISNTDLAELTALVWDLGACYVVRPSDSLSGVPDLVGSLIEADDT